MYKVILVDDEEQIREGIKNKIPWAEKGFELVATAENGVEALELASLFKPDLILTDIRMPFMDGLELGQHLREKMPEVKLVIITGFDDFQYAQKAIQINVTDYILKPVDAEDITNVLGKVRAQLDLELKGKFSISKLRQNYLNNLPLLKEQFFSRLVCGHASNEIITEKTLEFDLPANAWWCPAIIKINKGEASSLKEMELAPMLVKKIVEEDLKKYCQFYCFFYNDYVAVLGYFSLKDGYTNLLNGLDAICGSMKRHSGINLSVGVGSCGLGLYNLSSAMNDAKRALEYSIVVGESKTIYIRDIEPNLNSDQELPTEFLEKLFAQVMAGGSLEINKEINSVVSFFSGGNLSLAAYRLSLLELISEIFKLLKTYQISSTQLFNAAIELDSFLYEPVSPSELRKKLSEILLPINEYIVAERENSSKQLVEKTKKIISKSYKEQDFSLDSLSKELHFSPNYFSTLFKKEMSMTFTDYLRLVRLEKAKELLASTTLLAKEIAQQVGYSDLAYFSYVFKKEYGSSPTKYRNQLSTI